MFRIDNSVDNTYGTQVEIYWQQGSTNSGNLLYVTNRNSGCSGACSYVGDNNAGPAAGNFYIASIIVQGDSSSNTAFYFNGAKGSYDQNTGSDFTPNAANHGYVGAGYGGGSPHFDGDMAEILIFDTGLLCTQRQAIESYLGQKWGVSVEPGC